jgi:hypothetical protein
MIYNPTTGWSTQIPPGATIPPGYIIVAPDNPLYQHLDPTKPYLPTNEQLTSPYYDNDAQGVDDEDYGYNGSDDETGDDDYDTGDTGDTGDDGGWDGDGGSGSGYGYGYGEDPEYSY